MRLEKPKLLVLSTILGVGSAILIHRCNEALSVRRDAPTSIFESTAPERIAVFSSAAVELLFAMGAGDRIVGVTRYAVFPAAATALPKLGGLMDINFERLTDLHPDLIIIQSIDPKIEEFARRRGIPFMRIELERISDVLRVARSLGKRLGMAAEGRALADRISGSLDAVRRRVEGRPKVPCFVSVDRTPGRLSQLLSCGKETFLTELLDLAGGRNVFDDMNSRYQTVSKEALLARAPEAILELKPGEAMTSSATAALITDWARLGTLPAARKGEVHVITHDAALLPGPRMAEVALLLAETLHPEVFGGADGGR